jgi:hypothetical protein
MKNTFGHWIKTSGKTYIAIYAFYLLLTARAIQSVVLYPESFIESTEAAIWSLVGLLIFIGFAVGITYHMIGAYKKSEK